MVAQRRHHKAPLRGALMRLEGAARRAAAKSAVFLKEHGFQTLIHILSRRDRQIVIDGD